MCGSDHSCGLACRTSFGLEHAAEMMPKADWFFVADDDLYVMTANVRHMLTKYNASVPIALGIVGCGRDEKLCEDHKGGFCGGGGYVMSRAALRAMVSEVKDAQSEPSLRREMIEATADWNLTNGYDDTAATCVMKRRGIQVEDIKGLYAWAPPKVTNPQAFYEHAISSVDPIPLSFHYLNPQMMLAVHDLVLAHSYNQEAVHFFNKTYKTASSLNFFHLSAMSSGNQDYQTQRESYVEEVNHQRYLMRRPPGDQDY